MVGEDEERVVIFAAENEVDGAIGHIDLARLAACTVLITHGIDDKVVPVAVARDLHGRIPGSGFQELPRRGHYFVYEPDEMENLLAALLKAHRNCPDV